MLTKKDLRADYPAKLTYTSANLEIAREAMTRLWNERMAERGLGPSDDRSGSCKFAALLSRSLFGGKLAGNYEHIFTINNGQVIDLNDDQLDVMFLGEMAHIQNSFDIEHPDYRESLGYCQARAKRWADWVVSHPRIELIAPSNSIEPEFSI
jgi:hypothetical protein